MLKHLISKFLDRTFLRFILVGIVNTLFGYSVMFIAYNVLNLNYWISSAANYFFGSILSYFLNKYYTFGYKKKSWQVILKFTFNIIICYLVAYGVAKPIMAWLLSSFDKKIQENIAMLFGMCLFVILNYTGQRFFAFKKEENS
ncbi:MAG: GtrA family protein [Bacteroidota bacterium]|nr:GtrA family protein [Bacteroidota bacterium]